MQTPPSSVKSNLFVESTHPMTLLASPLWPLLLSPSCPPPPAIIFKPVHVCCWHPPPTPTLCSPKEKVPWSYSRCEHLPSPLSLPHSFPVHFHHQLTPPTSLPPSLPHAAASFPFPFLVKKSQTGAGRRTFHQRQWESVCGGLCTSASSGQWNSRLSITVYTHYTVFYSLTQT